MTPVTVTCRRTLSRMRHLITTALAVGGFLAASAALFAFRLEAASGTRQALTTIWATSISPFLPVLAAFVAMGVWSEERASGRIDMLLSVCVRERDYAIGKALGVWTVLFSATLLSLVSTVLLLAVFDPSVLANVRVLSFGPALMALGLQGALWATASVAVSAMCVNAFAAAMVSLTLLTVLPRGLWEAALRWAPAGRSAFGEMPLDAMVADISSGLVSTGEVAAFAVLTVLSLFLAAKSVALLRLVGKGGARDRFSTVAAMALSVVCSFTVIRVAFRVNVPVDFQVGSPRVATAHMRRLLADSSGHVTVSAFLPRKSPEFRPVAQYLRFLKRQADSVGGLALTLQFVDPAWDVGEAGRLVRRGVAENSLVFEKGGRLVSIALADGYGDRTVASALRSIALPPQHRDVYWTTGHGESSFADYGPWGLSDIARELVRNGYRNEAIDLSADRPIPSDCALIAIAGAKDVFSRAELNRLDAYLREGGRLLVLQGPSAEGGVTSLLPAWGLRPQTAALPGAGTLSGTDVIVSDFADHVLTSGLSGSRLVLESPLTFAPSAVVGSGTGVDRLEFASVARVGTSCLVAAVERGRSAGADLAVRPARIVAVGDPSFVANAPLSARGNANGLFFLNAVAYLSGSDVTGGVPESGLLGTGLDRAEKARFLLVSAGIVPVLIFGVMAVGVLIRRWRK